MAGNTFGVLFKITTFGESHGPAIGVVIDGCPSGLILDRDFINAELQRRKPGQSSITTSRVEDEDIEILSGVFENKTTGAPLCIIVRNKDQRSQDYEHLKNVFRPSHADYTYQAKYGIRDYRGGGRSSARETVARVISGAVAKIFLQHKGITINAYVSQVGNVMLNTPPKEIDLTLIESNSVRCPDSMVAQEMIKLIETTAEKGDSVGGVVSCMIKNLPVGLGEPVFDKFHAELAKAMLSINACKGFEIGSGFASASSFGSKNNDAFYSENNSIYTSTNNSGGVQGGITNGEAINFRCAFKPVSTIRIEQSTVSDSGENIKLKASGRHDPCVVPRAVPIVEAMAAIVVVDFILRQKAVQL